LRYRNSSLNSKTKEMTENKYRTDFLFARSGFFVAMGSIFNIAGKYFEYNYSDTAKEADDRAIESDWGAIGNDLETTVEMNPNHQLTKGQQ
jgi:hypothetical protein